MKHNTKRQRSRSLSQHDTHLQSKLRHQKKISKVHELSIKNTSQNLS